jgi:DNA-binding NarL/FixJ family response regulator
MPRTVLIVDHASFRASARMLLESEGFEVVGEAADGASALTAAAELRPDLALVDVHLPDFNGFEVAARLGQSSRPPRVVLTSSRDASDFGPMVARSGALGFVPKSELSGETLSALIG